MKRKINRRISWRPAAVLGAFGLSVFAFAASAAETPTRSVIVQSESAESASRAVVAAGGTVTHDLGIIRAVAASLTEAQVTAIEGAPGTVRLYANGSLEVAGGRGNGNGGEGNGNGGEGNDNGGEGNGGGRGRDRGEEGADGWGGRTAHPYLVEAHRLHAEGINGYGVTVAVLDTGIWMHPDLTKSLTDRQRILARYDVLEVAEDPLYTLGSAVDRNGHGSHVSSIIFSRRTSGGLPDSIAPEVEVVVVQAFDHAGLGTYADVIHGLHWVVQNKDAYGIRVLNLSFSAEPRSHYWDDPLNQAVMEAWRAGIVVVASAGNGGPDPMTIGVPGNVPYVITVGAYTDGFTVEDRSDDLLASFSSAGPTVEGFVKPEVVAPGGHVLGLMEKHSVLPKKFPEFYDRDHYFQMSGTSQATAVVSGIAALVLQANPQLTPDEVKCRILSSARPAVGSDGSLAYSVFQQGAGLINAYDAVYSPAQGCANRGLDVDKDLAGVEHYGGRANLDENGYYIEGLDGYLWSDGYLWADGLAWSDAYLWGDGFAWSDAYLWNDGYLWSDAYLWNDASVASDSLTRTMTINEWVDHE